MKKLIYIVIIPVLFIVYLISPVTLRSNWIMEETNSTLHTHSTPFTQSTPHTQEDSLPEGVTKDWLNSLRDENGNRIMSENNPGRSVEIPEDPEGDAFQRKAFNGLNTGENFGFTASNAGDVNGDGYDDIIVGAYAYSSSTGRAYVYYGGIIMNNVADVIMTGEAANSSFGISVSSAGDVNGDGYSDVIVGANGYSTNTGRAYIFFGGAAMNNAADVTMTGDSNRQQIRIFGLISRRCKRRRIFRCNSRSLWIFHFYQAEHIFISEVHQ